MDALGVHAVTMVTDRLSSHTSHVSDNRFKKHIVFLPSALALIFLIQSSLQYIAHMLLLVLNVLLVHLTTLAFLSLWLRLVLFCIM